MDALQAGVAAMGMFYPSRDVSNAQSNWDSVVRLIAKLPTIVAAFHRLRHGDDAIAPRDDLGHAANFYYMLTEQEPSPAVAKVLDACLILHAEHTMNASTFSGRVTGSTLANPYTVVSSAIGTLTGPLHGGANEEVLRHARRDRLASRTSGRGWTTRVAAQEEDHGLRPSRLQGEGPAGDGAAGAGRERLRRDRPAEDVRDGDGAGARGGRHAYGPKGIYPNVDFYSGIVYQALGIPRDLFTPIFAIARVAGWLSHWLEQLKNNRIFRPEQIYVGKHDVPYVPLEKRP